MEERITDPEIIDDDVTYDTTLRPKTLKDFVGQEK